MFKALFHVFETYVCILLALYPIMLFVYQYMTDPTHVTDNMIEAVVVLIPLFAITAAGLYMVFISIDEMEDD